MATHAVVVDASARQTTIHVSPSTALSEVLHQACTKRSLRPENYELKYNKKAIDHSLTWRLSNLPRGAKLDLVQASRSASVVTVALQLPDNTRLTNKFASTTSLWQILRYLEDKGDPNRRLNLTQREVMAKNMASGSGRLFYAQPTLNFMGREFGSFVELQKTLSQLGFGGGKGSLLLRLGFRDTQTPLEEAMEQIGQYFKSIEEPETSTAMSQGAHAGADGALQPAPEPSPTPDASTTVAGAEAGPEPSGIEESVASPPTTAAEAPPEAPPEPSPASPDPPPPAAAEPISAPAAATTTATSPVDPSNRPTTVFLAPSSSTPQAARASHNAADYEPTVEHAKLHQARLNHESKNKRLASDRELDAQAEARAEKLSTIASLDIRIRLPDQSAVQTAIGPADSGASLYTYVRTALLAHPDTPFVLRYLDPRGRYADLPDAARPKLIQGLGFSGRMALVLAWAPGANVPAGPVLRPEVAAQARAMAVPEFSAGSGGGGGGNAAGSSAAAGAAEGGKGKSQMSGAEKESKLKGLLMKGFSKK